MQSRIVKLIALLSICNQIFWSYANAQEPSKLEPREFCNHNYGVVSETGLDDVFICCYTKKQKCVVSNIKQGYSQIILLQYKRGQLDLAKSKNGNQ